MVIESNLVPLPHMTSCACAVCHMYMLPMTTSKGDSRALLKSLPGILVCRKRLLTMLFLHNRAHTRYLRIMLFPDAKVCLKFCVADAMGGQP
jgi:hypothetical protein